MAVQPDIRAADRADGVYHLLAKRFLYTRRLWGVCARGASRRAGCRCAVHAAVYSAGRAGATDHQGVLYSAADIYFSAITPSATGGQPASAVLMMRSGIPAAPTAVALLINLVLYTLSILLMAAAGLALHPGLLKLFGPASRILIWVGAGTQVALLAGLTLLIFHEPIFLRLADWALKIGHKLHLIRDIESRKQKYAELRDDYQQCSGALRGQWKLILLSFVFNLAQRLAIVLSPVCVYLAEGGNRARTGEAFAAQTMVILGSNAVPLPGSVGVADYLFLDGYRSLAQSPVLLELLSRAISFYSCVVLCGALLLVYAAKRKLSKER